MKSWGGAWSVVAGVLWAGAAANAAIVEYRFSGSAYSYTTESYENSEGDSSNNYVESDPFFFSLRLLLEFEPREIDSDPVSEWYFADAVLLHYEAELHSGAPEELEAAFDVVFASGLGYGELYFADGYAYDGLWTGVSALTGGSSTESGVTTFVSDYYQFYNDGWTDTDGENYFFGAEYTGRRSGFFADDGSYETLISERGFVWEARLESIDERPVIPEPMTAAGLAMGLGSLALRRPCRQSIRVFLLRLVSSAPPAELASAD